MTATAVGSLPERLAAARHDGFEQGSDGVSKLGWSLLSEEPADVVAAIDEAIVAGIDPEQLGRAVAFAAALRITRFHTQNDHGDWDEVHHAFIRGALHQALRRAPTPELLRGVYHGALRIYLDRFLNVPAARLPEPAAASGGRRCRAGGTAELLGPGGPRRRCRHHHLPVPARRRRSVTAIATLGHALLTEDAEFHWFQTYEAAVRQFHAWPAGSEKRVILAGTARTLAAHTPTRRDCPRSSASPSAWVAARRSSSHPDAVGVAANSPLAGLRPFSVRFRP